MKTKLIPALLALAAGFITCIISFLNEAPAGVFVRNLCLAVVCFLILGGIIKLVLDKNFPSEQEEEGQEAFPEAETKETEIKEAGVEEGQQEE